MVTSTPHVVRLQTKGSRSARRVGIAAIAIGLLLAPVTGLITRQVLLDQGHSVATWEEGVSIALRATLLAVLPCFLFFGWLAAHSLRLTWEEERTLFPVRRVAWIGALAGLALAAGWALLALWPDPHFFGTNLLVDLPDCLLVVAAPATAGAVVGGIVGHVIGRVFFS